MAGKKNSKEKLNNTLLFIIKLLNANNINNWFIGYGTLLGIIRENSCIDGDDDIDIIIDINNYDQIKKILMENGIKLNIELINNIKTECKIEGDYILKTEDDDNYCSIDFYMAIIDEEGNYDDKWERVIWSECYNDNKELVEYMWNENKIYLPFNYEKKLIGRYGEDWKIPQDNKGIFPRKSIL